jgi:hypothetical protein
VGRHRLLLHDILPFVVWELNTESLDGVESQDLEKKRLGLHQAAYNGRKTKVLLYYYIYRRGKKYALSPF